MTISQCGIALYGEYWVGALSQELGVSDRSLRRWVNGTVPIPDGVWRDIHALMVEKRTLLDAAIAEIEKQCDIFTVPTPG